jgi:hypothetical protein
MSSNIHSSDIDAYAKWFLSVVGASSNRFSQTFPLARASDLSFAANFREWELVLRPRILQFGALSVRDRLRVQLVRLLIETGLAMTPVDQPLSDFRAAYAVLRYAEYFRPRSVIFSNTGLTLNDDPGLRSRRLKSLMSEELACGIACYLLREYLGAVHIIDYQSWRDLQGTNIENHYPDYYAITASRQGILVEVKGTIAAKKTNNMKSARTRGASQVCNGSFGAEKERSGGSRFVISTCFVQTQSKSDTTTYVESINAETGMVGISPGPKRALPYEGSPRDAVKLSYVKLFRYVGLDKIAELVLAERTFSPFELLEKAESVILYQRQFVPLGTDPFNNLVLIDSKILLSIADGEYPTATNEIRQEFLTSAIPQEAFSFSFNDSVIISPNPRLIGYSYWDR